MAFKLDVPSAFGVNAGYHKITELRVDFVKREATILIQGWKNRAESNSGVAPLTSNMIGVGADEFDFVDGEVDRARAYVKARALGGKRMSASGELVAVPSKWATAVDD